MPTLPAQLRLSDSDDAQSDDEQADVEQAHGDSSQPFNSDNPYSSQSQYGLRHYDAGDEEVEERLDRERIEKTLQEMMTRQRQNTNGTSRLRS